MGGSYTNGRVSPSEWLEGRKPSERVFAKMPRQMARSFGQDLEAARSAWIDDANAASVREQREQSDFLRRVDSAGRVVDFHATRHTFVSAIVAGGASVKTAQELARHSTPMLTIGWYAHTRLHDLTGALESLPSLVASNPITQSQTARGTDGKPVNMPANRQQYSGETRQHVARIGNCVVECIDGKITNDADAEVVTLSLLGSKKAASGGTRLGAEGTGLEPATGKPAPDFESGC